MSQERKWHIIGGDGAQSGPYSEEQLRSYAADGTIVPTTHLWTEGLETWIPAMEMEGLFPSPPNRPRLLTGAAAQATRPLATATPNADPSAACPPLAQRRSGVTTLIVLGITVPLLIAGVLFIYTRAKDSRDPAQTAKVGEDSAITSQEAPHESASGEAALREQPPSKKKATLAPSADDPDYNLAGYKKQIETVRHEIVEAAAELDLLEKENAKLTAAIKKQRSDSVSLNREIDKLRAMQGKLPRRAWMDLISQARDLDARELPTTAGDVTLLLEAIPFLKDHEQQDLLRRLLLAKSSDGGDLDKQIATFAVDEGNACSAEQRSRLFQVLRARKGASAVVILLRYAAESKDLQTAGAALQAVEKTAQDRDLPAVLGVIQASKVQGVRRTAQRVAESLVERSNDRASLASIIRAAYDKAPAGEAKHLLGELLGTSGGDNSAEVIHAALKSKDVNTRLSAIAALAKWPDDSQFQHLLDYIKGEQDEAVRLRAFETAFRFLRLARERDELDIKVMWKNLAGEAEAPTEKKRIIDGMAARTEDWAFAIVETLANDADEQVSFRAERALEHMNKRR